MGSEGSLREPRGQKAHRRTAAHTTGAGTPLRVPGVPHCVHRSPRHPEVSRGRKTRSKWDVYFEAREP